MIPAVSFDRLPQDLLMLILFFLVRWDSQPLKKLHVFRQVFRKLQGVVDDTPALWKNMALHDPEFLLKKA